MDDMPGDRFLTWSDAETVLRVLLLRDYNTRIVVVGTLLFGVAAGLVGTFLLLRKRALLSDAISHATLPGIVLAFMVMVAAGGSGKALAGLLAGAVATGVLGMLSVVFLRRVSRLKDDAALGIVLSVYFGLGVALLGLATRMEAGNAAGLDSFIYGKTASMLFSDAMLITAVAGLAAVGCMLLFKEFSILCFDAEYATAQGWPVLLLDLLLMALVVIVTVIGLQSVGLILVVALLIIPPAAARFWTHSLGAMLAISAVLGGMAGMLGSAASALMENLPAGAIIVLVAAAIFLVSLLFGSDRGLLHRVLEQRRLAARVARQHLLRALFETREAARSSGAAFEALLSRRSWPAGALRLTLRRAAREGLVWQRPDGTWVLSEAGLLEAQKVVRNHRLWEMYLITHADVAPAHVDRDADRIEHVLDDVMIRRLESLILEQQELLPPSPHGLERATG